MAAAASGYARGLRVAVACALAASALAVLAELHALARNRYFSVDEYQFGHASWLVSQGQVPYVDFYEHHFPASYVLHAPLVAGDAPFAERALRLRSASFAWLVLLSLSLAAATAVALRDPLAALLAAQLPLAFGFSALSAVDYRADNFAGVAWIACLAALEVARRSRPRVLCGLAGALLALAVLSTQKLLLLGGLPVAIWLAWDWLAGRRRAARSQRWIAAPGVFLLCGGVVTALALCAAAALGMLGPGYESTVLHALGHEELYPEVALLQFVRPFLAEAGASSALLLLFAGVGFATREGRFYALPLLVSLCVGLWIRGRFPYNYLVPCVLSVLLSVRGYVWLVRRAAVRWPGFDRLAPTFYLLPLLLLPDQLGFVRGRTSNAHQLHVLAKIERYSAPGDVVIDAAGGALFRDHASHVWYHGPAHRALMTEFFQEQHLRDLRASRAPLWIRDLRFGKLPAPTRRFLEEHYVRADGWLYALGFVAEPEFGVERRIDVVRGGLWHAYPAPGGLVAAQGPASSVWVDERPVGAQGIELDAGSHTLRVAPEGPPVLLTPLPRALFLERFPRMRPYALLFEYQRKPVGFFPERTLLSPRPRSESGPK